jgi:hypothetical protein
MAKRDEYLKGVLTFHDYYGLLVELLGEGSLRAALPGERTPDQWRELLADDPHLNNVPLAQWDFPGDSVVRRLVRAADQSALTAITGRGGWSLSDSTCVLKETARRYAAVEPMEGCRFCDTTDTGRFDDDGPVCVDCKSSCFVAAQWPGVAVRFVGYVTETVHPECPGHAAADEPNDGHAGIGDVVYCDGSCQSAETETDFGTARVVMVGDDREHEVALDDLIDVDDADFCSECGQVGCGHDGRAEEA